MDDYPLVLIVEDNPTQQKLIRLIADLCRIDPRIVESCHQALEALAEKNSYRLILMDWHLGPNSQNGLDCARLIRMHEKESGGHIPIIGVTASAMQGDREACIDAGMDDYISKPYSLEDLETVLNKWLVRDNTYKFCPRKLYKRVNG